MHAWGICATAEVDVNGSFGLVGGCRWRVGVRLLSEEEQGVLRRHVAIIEMGWLTICLGVTVLQVSIVAAFREPRRKWGMQGPGYANEPVTPC